MGKKYRQGKPWMPGYRYAALLTPFALNLIVADVERSVQFYIDVLQAEVHYHDVDFAAVRIGSIEMMIHADHTHDDHPWMQGLAEGDRRGVGAQFRLLGVDPDDMVRRAQVAQAEVIAQPQDKGHGWREAYVRDPDGYEWAVGVLIPPAKGPLSPQD